MRRPRLWVVIGVAVLLTTGTTLAVIRSPRFQKWYKPPVIVLPDDSEVAEMRASLLESQVGFPRVPEFVVPGNHVPVILRWLRPGEYVSDPPTFPQDELGAIWIKTKTGKEIRLRFFWAGKNPVVYTIDGTDYFWGNDEDEQGHWVDGGIRLGKAVQTAFETSRR
jgi:hypothetical protein